jgi:tetrahedral aminopeptidase
MAIESLRDTLRALCLQVGVSEYERECGISGYLFDLVSGINPRTEVDSFGNIISRIGSGPKSVIIEAHMDEVGFVVEETDEATSLIYMRPQGIIKGEEVRDSGAFIVGKQISGTIETDKGMSIFMPTQASDGGRVEKGDIVAFDRYFSPKENDVIEANSLDNRIGCSVLLDVMTNVLSDVPEDVTLIFVFSTREEVDRSDFSDVIRNYGGDFAIVVDAAYAQPVEFDMTQDPDIEIPVLGEGCAMQLSGKGFTVEEKVLREIRDTADAEGISLQRENAPKGFGKTNFAKMLPQGVKSGAVINIPVRDQHQQSSSVSISDAEGAARLILALLKRSGRLCASSEI